MIRRLGLVLVALALVSGCGGDDGDSSSPASPADQAREKVKDLPTDAEGLKARCVEELTEAGEPEADAEKTCTVPDEADVEKAVDAALRGCLAVAEQLPSGSVRDQAEQDCRDSVK